MKRKPIKNEVINISPNLSKDDIEIKINNKSVKILELNQVKEYADEIYSLIAYLAQLTLPKRSLIAYLIQAALPIKRSKSKGNLRYNRIDVTIRDVQTGKKARAVYSGKSTEQNSL